MNCNKIWLLVVLIVFGAELVQAYDYPTNPYFLVNNVVDRGGYAQLVLNRDATFSFPIDGSKLTEYIYAVCLGLVKNNSCINGRVEPTKKIVNGHLVGICFELLSIYKVDNDIAIGFADGVVEDYILLRGGATGDELNSDEHVMAGFIKMLTDCHGWKVVFDNISADHYDFDVYYPAGTP